MPANAAPQCAAVTIIFRNRANCGQFSTKSDPPSDRQKTCRADADRITKRGVSPDSNEGHEAASQKIATTHLLLAKSLP